MKKALCVLLSALLLSGAMSCMLTVASAASYITTINLRGVNVPVPDRSGDYILEYESTYQKLTQYDDGEVRVNGVGWMDVTGSSNRLMDQNELFQAGHTYRVTVLLEAKSGYQFKNGVAAYVNGTRASTYEVNGDDGDCRYIGVNYTFPVCEYTVIDSVGVTNVPLPRPGQKAVDCKDVINTASGNYYVSSVDWYKIADMGEEKMMSATDKFESSTTYRVAIWLNTAKGFKFQTTDDMPDVDATVNGENAMLLESFSDTVVCLLYDFYIPHPLTEVAVTRLDVPAAGAEADTSVGVDGDCGYKVTKIEWFDSTDPLNNFKVTRFEAGKTYTVKITLTTIGNNSFYIDEEGRQDVDCYINDSKANSYSSQEYDEVVMYKSWTLAKPVIDVVAVYGIVEPVAGATPDTTTRFLYENCGYEITDMEWVDADNNSVTVFEAGKTYKVNIELTTLDGYVFNVDDGYQEIRGIINGYEVQTYGSHDDKVATIYKQWTLAGDEPGDEPGDEVQDKLILKADSTYTVDHENRICTMPAGQTADDVIANAENEFLKVVADEKNKYVGTGCVIQVLDDEQNVLSEYTVLVCYDADGDGEITASDARTTLRTSVNLDTLSGIFAKAADVNGDNEITSADARSILRKSVGLD